MTDIAAALRQAAECGDLSGFTLWPCSGGWQASVRGKSTGWRVAIRPDPVAAVTAALGATEPTPETDIFA